MESLCTNFVIFFLKTVLKEKYIFSEGEEMRKKNMEGYNGDAFSVQGRAQNKNKNNSTERVTTRGIYVAKWLSICLWLRS